MRVPITKLFLSTAAVVGTAVLFAACSDSTTSPTPRSLTPGNPDLAVVLQQTINSGSNISYCGFNATQNPVVGTVYAPPAGGNPCIAANDLQTALASYNPGWGASFNGTDHWIGPTDHLDPLFPGALSNQYVADVGSYSFQFTFTVPANAISLTNGFVLNVKSDNAVQVYLNGSHIGGNDGNMQDCPTSQTNCNWTAAGAVTATGTPVIGVNTVRIDLLGSAIGFQLAGFTPRSTCAQGPQFFGFAGFSGPQNVPTPQHLDGPNHNLVPNWVIATCKNPTGVDFTAAVSYDIASTIWCSPGFWKNNGRDLWTSLQGLLYNTHGPYPNDPQTFAGFDFGKKTGSQNPTMLQVIDNPSVYGGAATNNVASFISNALFGTPITANPVENCPDILPLPAN